MYLNYQRSAKVGGVIQYIDIKKIEEYNYIRSTTNSKGVPANNKEVLCSTKELESKSQSNR